MLLLSPPKPQLLLEAGPPPPMPTETGIPELDSNFDNQKGDSRDKRIAWIVDDPADRYWKIVSLDRYTGQRWTTVPNPPPALTRPDWTETHTILAVEPPPSHAGHVPTAGAAVAVDPAASSAPRPDIWPDGTIHTPVQPGSTFTVTTCWPNPNPNDARLGGSLDQPIPDYADNDAHRKVTRLARALTSGATNRHDAAERICAYLREEYTYDLDAPYVFNPVHNFLFVTKKGSCQHFAGSAAVMLRLVGVPARLAGGFSSRPGADSVVMRYAEAHVWVEVLLEGIGWVAYESQAPPPPSEDGEGEPDEDESDPGGQGGNNQPAETPVVDEIEEDDEEEEYEEEEEEEKPPIPVLIPEPFFKEFQDLELRARSIGLDLRRIMLDAEMRRYRGNYETGGRLNTSQLARLSVGDNRVQSRRKQAVKRPIEVLMAHDESPSVRAFQGDMALVWNHARWLICQALHHASQDFGVLGFHGARKHLHWYKKLGEPFDDKVRDDLINLANLRIQSGSGTRTHDAVEALRKEHQRVDPTRKRIGLVLTDGEPNSGVYGDIRSAAAVRAEVRKQVELAHTEGLEIIGVILIEGQDQVDKHAWAANSVEATRDQLNDMFDHVILLSHEPDKADDQFHHALIHAFRNSLK